MLGISAKGDSMSYIIFIQRKTDPGTQAGQISYEEWRCVAEADPELAPCDDPGESSPVDFRWNGRADFPEFHYYENLGVGVNAFGTELFAKMFSLAEKLSAEVVGEQGERFRQTDRGVEQYWEDPRDGAPTIVC